jgi:hypothetical protein
VYCFGDPAKMSDESVKLSLRIHDEVCLSLRTDWPPLTQTSATEAMYLAPTFAPAAPTSFSVSRRRSRRHKTAEVVSSSISEKKAERWERSRRYVMLPSTNKDVVSHGAPPTSCSALPRSVYREGAPANLTRSTVRLDSLAP